MSANNKNPDNVVVIKCGGAVLTGDSRYNILRDINRLSRSNSVLFVHGGGVEVSQALEKSGVKPRFLHGRRVTDRNTLAILEQMLSGKINKELTGNLLKLGARAVGLSCRDGGIIIAGRSKNLGWAGHPQRVNALLLKLLLRGGYLPVISPVSGDRNGNAINVNADEAAAHLACALSASRLIFVTDVCGVLDANGGSIPRLTLCQMEKLISTGVIKKGMLPKVESCEMALSKGVGSVEILDGTKGFLKSKGTIIVK